LVGVGPKAFINKITRKQGGSRREYAAKVRSKTSPIVIASTESYLTITHHGQNVNASNDKKQNGESEQAKTEIAQMSSLIYNAGLCGGFEGAKRRKNRPTTAPG